MNHEDDYKEKNNDRRLLTSRRLWTLDDLMSDFSNIDTGLLSNRAFCCFGVVIFETKPKLISHVNCLRMHDV